MKKLFILTHPTFLLITQNGKAIALLMGLENFDSEQWNLQLSPEFWHMISERRQYSTILLSLVEDELENLGDD